MELVFNAPVATNAVTNEHRISELEKHIECLKNQVEAANKSIVNIERRLNIEQRCNIEQQRNIENTPKCNLPHITYDGSVYISMNNRLIRMINDALISACPLFVSFVNNDYEIIIQRNTVPVVVCRIQSQSTVYTIDLHGNVINKAYSNPDRYHLMAHYAPESCEDDTLINAVNLQANWDDFTDRINKLTNEYSG